MDLRRPGTLPRPPATAVSSPSLPASTEHRQRPRHSSQVRPLAASPTALLPHSQRMTSRLRTVRVCAPRQKVAHDELHSRTDPELRCSGPASATVRRFSAARRRTAVLRRSSAAGRTVPSSRAAPSSSRRGNRSGRDPHRAPSVCAGAGTFLLAWIAVAYRHRQRIGVFYPQGSLEQLAQRISSSGALDRIAHEWRMSREFAIDLARLALFDIVLLCDDSGSMGTILAYYPARELMDTISVRGARLANLGSQDGRRKDR